MRPYFSLHLPLLSRTDTMNIYDSNVLIVTHLCTDGAKAQPVGFKPALSFKGYSPENGECTHLCKLQSVHS